MISYIFRGLLITFAILLAFLGVGFGVGAITYKNLISGLDNAQARGYEEGYVQGYDQGVIEGNEAGYQEGSKSALVETKGADASLVDDKGYYFLYNPTYNEVMMALTEANLTTAKDILDYAKANGMRAAYVRVPIAREARPGRVYLYQLVAFDTVDKGFIIVEPASHRDVKVEVGKSYSRLNGFPPSSFDDTITKVTVVW